MSKSTPDDLAVAFRSLLRRRAEAVEAADGAADQGLLTELQGHLDAAGGLLGVGSDPGAIAGAIAAKNNVEWDDATLDALRQHASDAGSVLRRVAETGSGEDD